MTYSLARLPRSRGARLALWYLIAVICIGLTYIAGPYIQFPIAYVLPVALAAWFGELGHALLLAVVLPLVRVGFVLGLWTVPWSDWHSVANAVIRIAVLSAVAVLASRAAEHRALRVQVSMLERILPICSFCKKIRDQDQSWHSLEAYLSTHTDIALIHYLCPECSQKQYGEYLHKV